MGLPTQHSRKRSPSSGCNPNPPTRTNCSSCNVSRTTSPSGPTTLLSQRSRRTPCGSPQASKWLRAPGSCAATRPWTPASWRRPCDGSWSGTRPCGRGRARPCGSSPSSWTPASSSAWWLGCWTAAPGPAVPRQGLRPPPGRAARRRGLPAPRGPAVRGAVGRPAAGPDSGQHRAGRGAGRGPPHTLRAAPRRPGRGGPRRPLRGLAGPAGARGLRDRHGPGRRPGRGLFAANPALGHVQRPA
mmetsp:Transcript_114710/g.348984  ORF Transcript_114710/g.348984 Transcript_114710/m.348984 type:complete len:243 (+) Transcript_114710:66-794(+)